MKKIFLSLIIIWSVLGVNSQPLSMKIKPYMSYCDKNNNYCVTELNLTNASSDTLIVWFVDSLKKDDDMQNIFDYFFTLRGDVTLANIIYDGSVSSVKVEIGRTFIKELLPNACFSIVFIGHNPQKDKYCEQFFRNNIVSVSKKALSSFNFTESPTWRLCLYNNDTIFLTY